MNKKPPIRSTLHEVLTQKRTSGATGAHRSKGEKKRSKYPGKWKRGED